MVQAHVELHTKEHLTAAAGLYLRLTTAHIINGKYTLEHPYGIAYTSPVYLLPKVIPSTAMRGRHDYRDWYVVHTCQE